MGEQLDSVMNYPFKEAIVAYALTGDKDEFISTVTHILENYPKESLDVLMNLIDSHDTARALTTLSGVKMPRKKADRAAFCLDDTQYALAKKRLKLASTLQYVLPGVPCVFYGDEAGVQGYEDPLNRVTYPWGREDEELLSHYRALGAFREKYADYLTGETHFVNDNDALIIERECEKGKMRLVCNNLTACVFVNDERVLEINA